MRHLLLFVLIAGCKTYAGQDTEFSVGDADSDTDADADTDADSDADADSDSDSDTGDTGS